MTEDRVPTKPGVWWRRSKNRGNRVAIVFVYERDGRLHWRHSRGGKDCVVISQDGLWAGEAKTPAQVRAIEAAARRDAFLEAAELIEAQADSYPEDIFVPPPAGQHGATVDGCSAEAIRRILPGLGRLLREKADG